MATTSDSTTSYDVLGLQWDLARKIYESIDVQQALPQVFESLCDLSDVDGAWLLCARTASGQIRLKCHHGLSAATVEALPLIETDSDLGARILQGLDIVERWEEIWQDTAVPLREAGWTDVALWPIVTDSGVTGALCVGRRGGRVSALTRQIADNLAAAFSVQIARQEGFTGLSRCSRNLSTLFDAFDDFVFIIDTSGHIQFYNTTTVNELGYGEDQLDGQAIDRLIPGAMVMIERVRQQLAGHGSFEGTGIEQGYVISADNQLVPVELRIITGVWNDRDVHYLVCRDVTKRQVMERERDRLVKAIEQAAECIIITDASGTIQFVNPAFVAMTGYSDEDAIGGNPRLLKSGQHSAEFYKNIWDTITRGETWSGRIVNRRRDGSLLTEESTISPVRDDNGIITHFVAVNRDVTHEVDLEERLRQSQKMEAIGTLAGGIAHDFNNILYALLGYTQLALDDIPADHPARTSLEEIERAGHRASALVAKMLTFSRRAESGRDNLQLQAVVHEALDLARASLPATITFDVSLDEDCPPVQADETQILQVMLNLCANAEHAMRADRGGKLTVRLHTDEAGSGRRGGSGAVTWIRLDVTDTGHGMSEAVAERVFEPYFTTKKANEGTGLGLATVHGIITDHGGRIEVKSAPGKGTTFSIFLPSVKPVDKPTAVPDGAKENEVQSGCGSLIIIDDEAMIVDVVTRALSRLGFEVTGFQDGTKALEAFRAAPTDYDVVITDQTMPDITGFELAAQMRKIRPDLPIILTTGYANLAEDEEIAAAGIDCFLPKPLRIGDLAEAVHRLIKHPVES